MWFICAKGACVVIRQLASSRYTQFRVFASLWFILAVSTSFTYPKNNKFVPPGTVMIYNGFYADEFEVRNIDWLEFEFWTATKYGGHSKAHLFVLPDTLCDRHKLAFCEPYVQYYYRHPAYREYPVRGISYEQAIAFCKWRTERVKEWHAIRYHKNINLEYRLPTKVEWEMLGLNALGYYFRDKKGKYDFNCLQPYHDSIRTDKGTIRSEEALIPVKSYNKNSFGLYQLLGNVSEMVAEKGIAKGGNYLSTAEECRPGKDQLYEKPEAWLGFRCVCTLKRNSE